jgi:hypothetical protein
VPSRSSRRVGGALSGRFLFSSIIAYVVLFAK